MCNGRGGGGGDDDGGGVGVESAAAVEVVGSQLAMPVTFAYGHKTVMLVAKAIRICVDIPLLVLVTRAAFIMERPDVAASDHEREIPHRLLLLFAVLFDLVYAVMLVNQIAALVAVLSLRFLHRHPRRRLQGPLVMDRFLTMLLVVAASLATIMYAGIVNDEGPKESQVRHHVRVYLILTWTIVALRIACYAISMSRISWAIWRIVLIIVKGRAASDSEIELDHVLDVVTTAFGHMSHLHAGIVHDLLHVVEAYQKHRMSQLVAVSSTPEPPPPDVIYSDDELPVLREADRIFNVALSSYGSWMVAYYQPKELRRALCKGASPMCCYPGAEEARHERVFELLSSIPSKCILASNLTSSVCFPAFVCAFDERHKELVVTVSGSISLADYLTDVHAHVREAGAPFPAGSYAHHGFLQSARNIARCLRASPALLDFLATAQGYKMIVTGHSLGGATASLLALLLEAEPLPSQPPLFCYSFSCPPIACQDICKMASPRMYQIAVDDDFLARMSLISLYRLLAQMNVLHKTFLEWDRRKHVTRQWAGKVSIQSMLHDFVGHLDYDVVEAQINRTMLSMLDKEKHRPLHSPGRLIRLGHDPRVDRTLHEGEIIVTPTMFLHHIPRAVAHYVRLAVEPTPEA